MYLNCVNGKMASHAAGSVLDGNSLSTPLEGAGLLWDEFPMVVCKTLCIFSVAFHENPVECYYRQIHFLLSKIYK